MTKGRVFVRHTVAITPQEFSLFMDAIKKSGDQMALRDRALFATYAFTGIRRSEALKIRIQDYDCRKNVIYVSCKGGKFLLKPVPTPLKVIYSNYLELLEQRGGDAVDCYMFPGRAVNGALTPRQVHNRFNKWKKMSHLRDDLTIHSFRAGFATSLYRVTGDLFLVSQALGHNDMKSTFRYILNTVLCEAVEDAFSLSLQ